MEEPQPLLEEGQDLSKLTGPAMMDLSKYRTLFSAEPKSGQWVPWIHKLLSDVPLAQIVEDNNHVLALCEQAEVLFKNEPNTLALNVGDNEDLVLVGDVHGQFKDLAQHVLVHQAQAKDTGMPDLKYLFLGDYVDRGPQSAEVLILLLALKVEYPDKIHMIRGNHEEFQTCRIYGFSHECQSKFKDHRVFTRFNTLFTRLPLAAIVTTKAGSLFVCHGGLSPNLSLAAEIDFVNREEYEGGSGEAGEIVDGLLWSDPCESGRFRQNARGCGYLFGPDATNAFLETNQFAFLVRAHQLAMAGYSWDHNQKVLTIFSAPNYCGVNNNKGCILVLHGERPTFENLDLRSYDAVTDGPPLFTASSPSTQPKPDVNSLHAGYFDQPQEVPGGGQPGQTPHPTLADDPDL
jgi:diadenosine tetraphosphatase ApaH/serine/threonine PP2A family protein phosphatase